MSPSNPTGRIAPRAACIAALLAAMILGISGCETDSFLDPSVVGRWEQTPVTLPILESLDVIEEPTAASVQVTHVRPADLVPDKRPYIVGPSDVMTVNIYELLAVGQEAGFQRQVDANGDIRLPQVGTVHVARLSTAQVEKKIGDILENKGILRNPTVSVVMDVERGNTFSIIGAPDINSTAFGTYQIPKPDFRLLDAIALARGVSERVKTLTIFRQVELTPQAAGEVAAPTTNTESSEQAPPPAPANPSQLIQQLMRNPDETGDSSPKAGENKAPAAPAGMEEGIEHNPGAQWVNVGGKWVKLQDKQGKQPTGPEAAAKASEENQKKLSSLISQRIIEIPYDKLLDGDMRYNIVIRPGDVIRVPDRNAGFVYLMGAINRPGAYTVPGENELTIKEVVAAAGNLSQLAIPERVDLVRRVGSSEEAIVRLNVRAIFEGTQPDIFLKPNDLLNFGTNFIATPLAIFRNGLRASYGFGFVLDRNFGPDVFGAQPNSNGF